MEYLKFFDALLSNRLITPIWRDILKLLDVELDDSNDKDDCLILFAILFALNDDGNICMSLDQNVLTKKWDTRL